MFCIRPMVLLITDLPVVQQGRKTRGQSPWRVKQKTKYLLLGSACTHMVVFFFQIGEWCVACYGKILGYYILFENLKTCD